jgi:hypothetical protein
MFANGSTTIDKRGTEDNGGKTRSVFAFRLAVFSPKSMQGFANSIAMLHIHRRAAHKIGCRERLGPCEGTRNIASGFVLIAWNLAEGDLRTALRSKFAAVAVALSSQIDQRGPTIHECPCGRQGLARGAMVDIASRIIPKIAAREGAVITLRSVEHRDMWRDTLSSTSQFSIEAAP